LEKIVVDEQRRETVATETKMAAIESARQETVEEDIVFFEEVDQEED